MFLIWGRGAGVSAVVEMFIGYVPQSSEGIESSSHDHCLVSVHPVNYSVMLIGFWGVELDCKLGCVIWSRW